MHYGIKGQKWGERRFQNLDGSYTEAGKARYADSVTKMKSVSTQNHKSKSSKTSHKSSRFLDLGDSPIIKNTVSGGYTDTYTGQRYDENGNLVGYEEPTAELDPDDGHFYTINPLFKSLSEKIVEQGRIEVDKLKSRSKKSTSASDKKMSLQERRATR